MSSNVGPNMVHGLRPAAEVDRRLLFEWANDPVTRRHSFSSAAIEWSEHCAWFDRVMAKGDTHLFIAEAIDGTPCGQARLDIGTNGHATVSVSVAPDLRGRGLGRQLIELLTNRAAEYPGLTVLDAMIRAENVASQRTFESAGYTMEKETPEAHQPYVHFSRRLG